MSSDRISQAPLQCDTCLKIMPKGTPYTRTDGGVVLCRDCCSPAAPA